MLDNVTTSKIAPADQADIIELARRTQAFRTGEEDSDVATQSVVGSVRLELPPESAFVRSRREYQVGQFLKASVVGLRLSNLACEAWPSLNR